VTSSTVSDLLKQSLITVDEVNSVVDAIVAEPSARRLPVGDMHTLNVAGFLAARSFVGKTLREPDASAGLK
jgi:hypothetical protein